MTRFSLNSQNQAKLLQIDTLKLADIESFKGHTSCIGLAEYSGIHHDTDNNVADWHANVAIDGETIHKWGANVWLNTMELKDLCELKIDPVIFKDVASNLGIAFYYFPIIRGGVPDVCSEQYWQHILSPILQACLKDGKRLLIQCRGGLGRAETVAAKLLVELGCSPIEAISRVRAIKANAISNTQQEAWVGRNH